MDDGRYEYTEWDNWTAIGWVVLAVSVVLLATGFFVSVLLFVLGLLGVALVFPLVFSFGRYSKVLVSSDLVAVGTDVVSVDDLDASFGARSEELVLTPHQRQQLDEITPRRYQRSEVPLLGGSWARPLGTKLVVISRTDGALAAIATRHPDELVAALNRVLRTRGQA